MVILEGRKMMEAFCGVWASQSSFAFAMDIRDLPAADQSTDLCVPAPPAKGASQCLFKFGWVCIIPCP